MFVLLLEEDEDEFEVLENLGNPTYVALKCLQKVDSVEHATSVINEVYFLPLSL